MPKQLPFLEMLFWLNISFHSNMMVSIIIALSNTDNGSRLIQKAEINSGNELNHF